MKTAVFAASLFALPFTIGAATAQPFPFNEAGVTNGHWHLNSKDVAFITDPWGTYIEINERYAQSFRQFRLTRLLTI